MTKGTIFDIKRYAIHDGPGIRTTVFLKGCAARCWWCHNPESQEERIEKAIRKNAFDSCIFEEEEIIGREITVDQLMTEISKDLVFYDESGGGVTFSGGEPLLQFEFLKSLLNQCNLASLHTALDTTGYVSPDHFEKIIEMVDLFLFDLKFIDDVLHQKYTGVSNKQILDNLEQLIFFKKPVQLRFPLIPGITDEKKNLDQIIQYIVNLNGAIKSVDVLPYHRTAKHKYEKLGMDYHMGDINEPTDKKIDDLKKIFKNAGLPVNIGG